LQVRGSCPDKVGGAALVLEGCGFCFPQIRTAEFEIPKLGAIHYLAVIRKYSVASPPVPAQESFASRAMIQSVPLLLNGHVGPLRLLVESQVRNHGGDPEGHLLAGINERHRLLVHEGDGTIPGIYLYP